jgi:hypothetical protein
MTFKSLVYNIIGLINYIVPVLIAMCMVILFWGIVKYVYQAGDGGEKSADKAIIFWGVIALFVVTTVWGLVKLLQQTFLA